MTDPKPAAASPIEDPEARWLRETYRPGAKQLTARAILFGMVIGAVMCVSNLYVVLKAGWSIGVTVTACILAFAIFRLLRVLKLAKGEFTELENNAMGSVASAAGYMTGGGNMAAVPALMLLTGVRPPTVPLMLWFGTIAALGVFAAIPIKRQMINLEQLPFPSGTATAETIKTLHAHGDEGIRRAKYLGLAALFSGLLVWIKDAKIPFGIPAKLGFAKWMPWSISFDVGTVFVGVGAIVGLRTAWSMLVFGGITYGVLAPWMVSEGVIKTVSYPGIAAWSLWTGAAVLVGSGLLSFALQWRMVARAFSQLGALVGRRSTTVDPLAAIEAPASWFPLGFLVFGPLVVILGHWMFQIPWWAGALALPLSVLMGIIASRVTGETDFTPTKALGPLTQITFGALVPRDVTVNVMSANITGGVGLHAADLLTDLKSGYLLGANPRQQVIAQLFGVVAGALVVVPVFNILITEPSMIGSEAWPAPSVKVWASVSQLLSVGIHALHPTARWGALCGLIFGCALVLIERRVPRAWLKYIPNASGVGTAMVIPFYNSLSVFIGAVLAWALMRRNKTLGEAMILPVSAGLIAGESLVGVAVALLKAGGLLS